MIGEKEVYINYLIRQAPYVSIEDTYGSIDVDDTFPKLIEAFCDSPYIEQENYADTLPQLFFEWITDCSGRMMLSCREEI